MADASSVPNDAADPALTAQTTAEPALVDAASADQGAPAIEPDSTPTSPLGELLAEGEQDSVLEEIVALDDLSTVTGNVLAWIETHLLTIDVAIQLGLISGALLPALLFGPKIKKQITNALGRTDQHGLIRRAVDALAVLATPIALYLILTVLRIGLGSAGRPSEWISGTLALLSAWIVVRIVTLVIQSQFWSRVAFYVAWPIAALDAFGALAPVVEQLQALAIPLGENSNGEPMNISLFDVIRTLIYFALLFWLAGFFSKLIEGKLENASDLSPSLRTMITKIMNIVLPVLALLIALQIVGFNLATLAVFSGAVGLGVGLGLQRIAANFIAGFTLLADRSIKPADVIEIDGSFGWVTDMQARYVAIRTRDGTEMLIPNDRFMSEGVTNWSRSDRVVRLHAPFGVTYATRDLRAIQKLAIDAALSVDRVQQHPPPACNVMEFGDNSVNFDLRFWILDPQNGMANVRSAVFIALWDALAEAGVEIPFPQRDLHIKSWPEAPAAAPDGAPGSAP
ncbi:MAG: mechanosensitive ion channel domain-containing protein [Pseudomonadota bacterium]